MKYSTGMEFSRTATNHGAHYQPFWELTRAALAFATKYIVNEVGSTGARATFDASVPRRMDPYRSLGTPRYAALRVPGLAPTPGGPT